MPIYEYACAACEKDFEELVRSLGEESSVRCPSCGSAKVTRRLSVFAARQGQGRPASGPAEFGGGCGRCGDPNGPCGM